MDEAAERRQKLQWQARALIGSLVFGGVMTMVATVLLAGLVSPFFAALALFGLADFWLAWMFASARLGPLAELRELDRADPSHNPYARED
jgi:HAMP domain-containing protein